MIHARLDYDAVQDTTGALGIADDEPVFLLRAKDALAPDTVRFWANLLRESGGNMETVTHVMEWADKMFYWQMENSRKLPDTPKEQLRKDDE